ncbi:MAG: hypothetical protein U1F30_00250 [Steroidobacteraceae bacterium]
MLMTYASVSTGFKGGGTNPRPFYPARSQPFDKENVTAYEVGFKSRLLDRRVRVNVAGVLQQVQGHPADAAAARR